ncbi:MAG: LacI family DNA-binding transcriptional regulator [Pseudomonadota bacterium]
MALTSKDISSPQAAAKSAKIEDVAREAGVSIMTVSRAMRGVEGVSRARRREILHIAKRLGYQPNSLAGSLAAANSTLIGVSVPTLFEAVFAEIFFGMRSTFMKAGFQTVIDTSEYQEDTEENWIDRMVSWRPAGIILTGVHHSEGTRERLRGSGLPILEIWDYSDDPIDLCIGVDHVQAGYDMGRHLVEQGYRRPAYVGVVTGRDLRAEARVRGLARAFEEIGSRVWPQICVANTASFEFGHLGTRQALDLADERPDVIYYLNDHMAFGGLTECERQGLRVPRDIGIVGFNGLNIITVLPKRLTTSITPRHQMGAKGAQMIVAKIFGAKTDRAVSLPVELSPGQTTRRVG